MKNKIKVSSSYNCPEKIHHMEPTTKGRFCGNCNKEVIDFTNSSIDEIIKAHHETNGQVCGIYQKNDLYFEEKKDINFLPPLKFIAAGLLAFTIPNSTYSINNSKPSQVIEYNLSTPKPYNIEGIIQNEKGEPIKQVKVYIKELGIETESDNNGAFNLVLNGVKSINTLIMVLEHNDYLTLEKTLTKDAFNSLATAHETYIMKSEVKSKTLVETNKEKYTITGTIIDENIKETMPFVNVFIEKPQLIGTTTDLDGNFKLTIPFNDTIDEVVLKVKSLGYQTKEVIVNKKGFDKIDTLKLSSLELNESKTVFCGYIVAQPVKATIYEEERVRGIPLHKKLFMNDRKIFGRD